MKARITYVERKASEAVSIERVFRTVVDDLPADEFEVKFESVPCGNGIGAILKNLLFFRRPEADIFHITGDVHYIALRLPGYRTVLTIHDLIFLHRRSGIRRYALKKLFLDIPVKRSARITTVSQATKDEILKHTDVDPDRITVIDNPISSRISASVVKPFNEKVPRILHIGTAANKNLPNLIRAVKGMNCTLRIIGKLDDKILEQLVADRVRYENDHGLDEHQIIEEYRSADIVSFCSVYEGFGLPILEAQAMLRPVVTSDISPMKEVAGEGAELVDPVDPASIRAGLMRIIDDADHRDKLIAAGAENVKRFDGRAISARYAEVYREMLVGGQ
jgi:glycosyltransferase involved in cell wall biosynthesis